MPYKPCRDSEDRDSEERKVRKALAALEGTDGDGSFAVVAARAASLSRPVSGIIMNAGLFQTTANHDVERQVYTDVAGEERIKMTVDLHVKTDLDLTKAEFDSDHYGAIKHFRGKLVDTLKFVMKRLESSTKGWLDGQSVAKLQYEFDSNPHTEVLDRLAVSPGERDRQNDAIRALNENILKEREDRIWRVNQRTETMNCRRRLATERLVDVTQLATPLIGRPKRSQ